MNDAPLIVLKELAGNPPPHLNALQQLFAPHVETLISLWIALWIMTAFVLIGIYVNAYREHRAKR